MTERIFAKSVACCPAPEPANISAARSAGLRSGPGLVDGRYGHGARKASAG